MRTRLLLATTLLLAGGAVGCSGDATTDAAGGTATTAGDTTTTAAPPTGDEADIEAVFVDVLDAEGAADGERLVSHFTDDGLLALYGSSREEILDPEYGLGEDGAGEFRSATTVVDGDTATSDADVAFGHVVFRVSFELVKEGGEWLISNVTGFDAPPAPDGVPDVDLTAVDYGFQVDADELSGGIFRLSFRNDGEDQHEVALFRVPEGTSMADGVAALTAVHGDSYDNVPEGYEAVDHLLYTEPGDGAAVLLAEPLEPGDYALICFIPQGGFDAESGEPVDPEGTPHILLGMYSPFTVG